MVAKIIHNDKEILVIGRYVPATWGGRFQESKPESFEIRKIVHEVAEVEVNYNIDELEEIRREVLKQMRILNKIP